jgi:hypothetical protein
MGVRPQLYGLIGGFLERGRVIARHSQACQLVSLTAENVREFSGEMTCSGSD